MKAITDLSTLSHVQVGEWYKKHPHPTVRAMAERILLILSEQRLKECDAYSDGVKAFLLSREGEIAALERELLG